MKPARSSWSSGCGRQGKHCKKSSARCRAVASPWIMRILSDLGHEVSVANSRKVRLIGESRKKDDRLDAQTLARLARIDPGLLFPGKHRSLRAQADLTLTRARAGRAR